MVQEGNTDRALDERRSLLFASLLRYAPEAGSLRERALDSIVQIGLLGSSAESPFRPGMVRKNLRLGTNATEIREEVISDALGRLTERGRVKKTSLKKRNAYYLTDSAKHELEEQSRSTRSLFDGAVERAFRNTEHFLQRAQAQRVFRDFLAYCFTKFGRRIAKTVTGHSNAAELTRLSDAVHGAERACKLSEISEEHWESTKSRCISFLESQDPDDARLRLHLTQGYYFSELLGIDEAPFSPLAEDAFRGAALFLDTNVIIPRLLGTSEGRLFDELCAITRRIGMRLLVTRATVNEARRVANDRREALTAIVTKLPDELMNRSGDHFVAGFLERRENSPDLTPEEFLQEFDRIPELLGQCGVEFVDETEEDLLPREPMAREEKVINDAAEQTRGFGKNGPVLRHDLLHVLLVQRERETNVRTWLLTRDRTLLRAADDLAGDGATTTLSLPALLQSISPFVTAGEEGTLSTFFSAALREEIQAFPTGPIFDLGELRLIVELHEDVLCTPADQLVKAFDYIKSNVLNGEPYRENNQGKVALELRKLLNSNADTERETLRQQAQRSSDDAADAKQQAGRALEAQTQLQEKLDNVTRLTEQQAEELTNLRTRYAQEHQHKRILAAVACTLVAGIIWGFAEEIASGLATWIDQETMMRKGLGLLGLLPFAAGWTWMVRGTRWAKGWQTAALSAALLIGIVWSRVASWNVWDEWSAPASLLVLLVPLFVQWGDARTG